MRLRLTVVTVALCVGWGALTAPVVAAEALPKGRYSTLQFTNAAGWVLEYDLYLPAAYTPEAKLPPIVMMHGMGVPVKATREMIAAVEAAGRKPKVTYFEGSKHAIWEQAWQTPRLIERLFAQSRQSGKEERRGEKP